ncbi:MAG TPA: chemotaxis protein CheB [Segetibacter sp.]|jgi:two-component system chemotaxis response regulator CheB
MLDALDQIELVLIGGSAGSLPVLIHLLKSLDSHFPIPIVIILHRQRSTLSELSKIISAAVPSKKIMEPDDKDAVEVHGIYIAPQNYHLLIEKDHTFSLDYSEAIQYSRPSIDVTFESAAWVYGDKLVSILLSGANNDGTSGLRAISESGGVTIAQDPAMAEYKTMPLSAKNNVKGIKVLEPALIVDFLHGLVTKGK